MTELSQTIADTAVEQPLLAALTGRDPAALAAVVGDDAALWEGVCARARDHRCLPYLYWVFDRAGVETPVPFAPAQRQRWVLRALAVQRECLRLHHLLSDAGIAHLFLKGVPLAGMAYPEPWLRPLRDIDLLVAPDDLSRAQALLLEHGGPIERYAHKADAPGDPKAKHLVPVWSPGQVIAVELHGRAADTGSGLEPEALARLDAALWADMTTVSVGEGSLPVPAPDVLFVHLVMHGVYDHELNNGPLFVTDLIHLLERMRPDPERIMALAKELGIVRGLALSLSLIPEGTEGRAALLALLRDTEEDLPALPQESAAALLLQKSAARTDLRLAADLADRSLRQRLQLVAGKVFASRETMTDRWRMEGHTSPPPRAVLRLWLWFVATRLRSLQRSGGAQPKMRGHLTRLRALRDGQKP